MEWGFVFGLAAITLVVVGAVIYLGLKLDAAVGKRMPDVSLEITLSGNILFACVVAFWVYCVAARILRPESSFGAFLNTANGVASIVGGSIVFAAGAGGILERLGYPIAKRREKL